MSALVVTEAEKLAAETAADEAAQALTEGAQAATPEDTVAISSAFTAASSGGQLPTAKNIIKGLALGVLRRVGGGWSWLEVEEDVTLEGTADLRVGLTAGCTVTLPPASGKAGQTVLVADLQGIARSTLMSIRRSGSDTIGDFTRWLLEEDRSAVLLVSDGGTRWHIVATAGLVTPDPRAEGVVAWWDAARGVTLTSGAVSQWDDLSGFGHHASQSTANRRPVPGTNADTGLAELVFDGSNDGLTVSDNSTYKAGFLTVQVVFRSTSGSRLVVGYPHAGTHTDPFFRWAIWHGTDALNFRVDTSELISSTLTNVASPQVLTYQNGGNRRAWRSANGVLRRILDGTAREITYPNAVGIHIGYNASVGEPLNGAIQEVRIFPSTLAESKWRRMHDDLRRKWRV
jgi:hypothetical protein